MKKETLMDAIGGVEERLIEEANEPKKRERHRGRWAGLAACLAIVVTAVWIVPNIGMGGNSGPPGSGPRSYHGPILPLTALSGGENLGETTRRVTMDMVQRGHYQGGQMADLTDSYTLTNPTDEDITVEVAYPFVTSLDDLDETEASLWVNGAQVEVSLMPGDYTGGFRGAGSEEGSLNLKQLTSFEEYAALLSDDRYLNAALDGRMDLSETTVYVYEFTDPWYEGEGENPSVWVEFTKDSDKTDVLTLGFHRGRFNAEEGVNGRGFSIRKESDAYYGQPYYFIVTGEDIQNVTTGVYATGGVDATERLVGGVTMERYETTLEDALRTAFDLMCEFDSWKTALGVSVSPEDQEMWFDLFCRHLVNYGLIAQIGTAERYFEGMLENMDFLIVNRVFWLRTEVTVPAGGTAEVTARLNKRGGSAYPGSGSGDNAYSYELATTLGSTLSFGSQELTVENGNHPAFPEQELQLDGEHTAALDLQTPCYLLTVEFE